ncbi:MAG TPA: hypothetical protein VK473_00105 [Terriglobales bacterium]|nr:hypothetical protein [Terriglobales bacterium]
MKLTKSLVFVLIAASGTACAQGAATANAVKSLATQAATSSSAAGSQSNAAPAKPAAKPATPPAVASGQTAAPAKAPAKPPATASAASSSPAATKPAAKPAGQAKLAPAAGKPQATTPKAKPATFDGAAEKKPEVKKSSLAKPTIPGTPELAQKVSVSGAAGRRDPFISPIVRATGRGPGCETGKKCLMIDQIALKGIVKSQNGMIAVVENSAHRAYFLRETDPVFNGVVEKITGDSVVFRETVTDKVGKQSTREVTKRVNAPVV